MECNLLEILEWKSKFSSWIWQKILECVCDCYLKIRYFFLISKIYHLISFKGQRKIVKSFLFSYSNEEISIISINFNNDTFIFIVFPVTREYIFTSYKWKTMLPNPNMFEPMRHNLDGHFRFFQRATFLAVSKNFKWFGLRDCLPETVYTRHI